MRPHLDLMGALRAVVEGRLVPRAKYAALQRASLIKVRGHGTERKPVLTDAGRAALSSASVENGS